MGEIVKWCITAVSAMLPAITIYLVVNVLSWKPGKKSAPKNEIAQPRQYFWCCAVGTMLLFNRKKDGFPERSSCWESPSLRFYALFGFIGGASFSGKKNLLVTSFYERGHTNIPKYISGIIIIITVFTAVKNMSVRFWMRPIIVKGCGA